MGETSVPDESELRSQTLDLLEFSEIRRLLANQTMHPSARELALNLSPSYKVSDVTRLQMQTREAAIFLEQVGDIDMRAPENTLEVVEQASLKGTLTGSQLVSVLKSLEVQRRVKLAFTGANRQSPLLSEIATGIPDLNHVKKTIETKVGLNGEVLDTATPTLTQIRLDVRRSYRKVTDTLEEIILSNSGTDAIQDGVISVRSDRMVLQVRKVMRNRVPGIVHDVSNTGSTLFIEPFASVDSCNKWRELMVEEENETKRILMDLSDIVGSSVEYIRLGTELSAQIDFILARARYSQSVDGVYPRTYVAPDGDPSQMKLSGARHPLIGPACVPINVRIGPDSTVLVITGPNTGGKTVSMKMIGLLALMHQSGLKVPVDTEGDLPVFDGVYADVGDQQSIQGSVSTFSSHIRKVIDILAVASRRSLVLLDELGTSTDPEEGSALAKAILGNLAAREVMTIVTTHYRAVADYAEVTDGIMNASVELDPDTLIPTYHLIPGLPGKSYAMSVADRMGLPKEIIDQARALLTPGHIRFEDWISELQTERLKVKLKLEEASEASRKAVEEGKALEKDRDELDLRRNDILEQLRVDMNHRFKEVDKKISRAESALSWGGLVGGVSEMRDEIAAAREEFRELDESINETPIRSDQVALVEGDLVNVRGLDLHGSVVSVAENGTEIEISVGGLNIRLNANRVSRIGESAELGKCSEGVSYELGPVLSTLEIDIRGLYVEDAIIKLEEFLDNAMRDGLNSVRIIHGKGTGALRTAVRDFLEHHPLARSFSPESSSRGSDGATLVELV